MSQDDSQRRKRVQRIAENELLFRSLNERIEEMTAPWDEAKMTVVCECGREDCFAPIDVRVAEFDRIVSDRLSGRRFIVKPGHEIPDVERLVERHEDYVIVEKPAEAMDLTRDAS